MNSRERVRTIQDIINLNIILKRYVSVSDICRLTDDELDKVKGYLITLLP